MDEALDLGSVYTKGASYRARAEARQRDFRANVLKVAWAEHGHWIHPEAADAGSNFLSDSTHRAVLRRSSEGKGVHWERTSRNMLSSQAMCFNIFAPLAADHELACQVLAPFVPNLRAVRKLEIEYTPNADLFRDQSRIGGVDCDVLIELELSDGRASLAAIETKFVEPGFSNCAYRDATRRSKGQVMCPEDVGVRDDPGACLYASQRRTAFRYWEQSRRLITLQSAALPERGCPFGGGEWQLWVNHTLVHAVAEQRGLSAATFIVCAPPQNQALLGDGILERFRSRLTDLATFAFLPLAALVASVSAAASTRGHDAKHWAAMLERRYGNI